MNNYNDFRKALQFVLRWEGTYSNDPQDPGGETKWGISKRAYPNEDIANLTPERAAEIYAKDYWDKCGCDNIDYPYNVAVFDTAVNCGPSRAVKWCMDCKSVDLFLATRKQFYYDRVNKNPPSIKYLKGWLNRLLDLQKYIEINKNAI